MRPWVHSSHQQSQLAPRMGPLLKSSCVFAHLRMEDIPLGCSSKALRSARCRRLACPWHRSKGAVGFRHKKSEASEWSYEAVMESRKAMLLCSSPVGSKKKNNPLVFLETMMEWTLAVSFERNQSSTSQPASLRRKIRSSSFPSSSVVRSWSEMYKHDVAECHDDVDSPHCVVFSNMREVLLLACERNEKRRVV